MELGPYRGIDPSLACDAHGQLPFVERCARCGARICEGCLDYEDARPTCTRCTRRVTRRLWRAVRPLLAVLAALSAAGAALALGIVYFAQIEGNVVVELRLLVDPCDDEASERLVYEEAYHGHLWRAGQHLRERQRAGCPWPVGPLSNTLYRHLDDEYPRAIWDLSSLFDAAVALQPRRAEAWLARAEHKARLRGLSNATEDFLEALALDPELAWSRLEPFLDEDMDGRTLWRVLDDASLRASLLPRHAQAVEESARRCRLDPDDWRLAEVLRRARSSAGR